MGPPVRGLRGAPAQTVAAAPAPLPAGCAVYRTRCQDGEQTNWVFFSFTLEALMISYFGYS